MTYYDLTEHIKNRFRANSKCRICKRVIFYDENLIYDKRPIGRYLVYNFYHEDCVVKENGKEKIKQQIKKEAESIKISAKSIYA